jgi:chromosome segregation ATPase
MLNEDLKVRSFRISEEVSEKLKHISENFDNQNAALESLISAYEIQSAKAILTDRQTDISDYDAHLQAIQNAFLHSLEINENAEKRIRSEFQSLLSSKDETIIMLQEQLEAAKASCEQAERTVQEVTVRAEQEAQAANEQIAEYIKQAENAEAAKNAAERAAEAAEAARKELHGILHDTKQQLAESRTDALRAKGEKVKNEEKIKELSEQLSEQRKRAEKAESELEKQKAAADITAERATVALEKAVVEEQSKYTKQIHSLYEEIDSLRKTIMELSAAEQSRPNKKNPVNS